VNVGCFLLIIIALFFVMVGVAGLIGGGMYTAMVFTNSGNRTAPGQSLYDENGSLRQDRKEYIGRNSWIRVALPLEVEVEEKDGVLVVVKPNEYIIKVTGDFRGKGAALPFVERAKVRARELADPDGLGSIVLDEAIKVDDFITTNGSNAVLFKFLQKTQKGQEVSHPIGVVEGIGENGKIAPLAVVSFDNKSTEKNEEEIRSILDSAVVRR
jgi:hypothetical protein